MNSLKAWEQDPEDWKIKHYTPKPQRKTFIQKLIPWLVAISIPFIIGLIDWFVEAICG